MSDKRKGVPWQGMEMDRAISAAWESKAQHGFCFVKQTEESEGEGTPSGLLSYHLGVIGTKQNWNPSHCLENTDPSPLLPHNNCTWGRGGNMNLALCKYSSCTLTDIWKRELAHRKWPFPKALYPQILSLAIFLPNHIYSSTVALNKDWPI